ncbi:hypothetical protein JOM56_011896 [Amanita muscaria]
MESISVVTVITPIASALPTPEVAIPSYLPVPMFYHNHILWFLQPTIFIGLYFASFIHCVRWLLFEDEGWRLRKKINWMLVTTTLLVFFFSIALFCAVVMQTIINVPDVADLDSMLANLRPVLATLDSSVIQWSILMVIDSVMIHRCWIVFSKDWFVICFPIVLWCFCLMCAILSAYCYFGMFFKSNSIAIPVVQMCFMESYTPMMPLAFYICNIVINMYTTSVLVYKIWRVATNNAGTNRLYRICRILTESGILYTLSSLIFLISWAYLNSSPDSTQMLYTQPGESALFLPVGFQIALGLSMFIPGIAFNLIIIRVGEQRANGEDTWVDSGNTRPELLNHPDTSNQVEMNQVDYERMDGEVMEINETEVRETTELARTPELNRATDEA